MAVRIEIDSKSGFCFGVTKAIEAAEKQLMQGTELYSLGNVVHNQTEVDRLSANGLISVEKGNMEKAAGKTILFRAHGEPPKSYQQARDNNINIIDATCPVVLKLQQRVKNAWLEMQAINGQVIIFGKKGHAEVEGLLGQTNDEALVIENQTDIDLIDFNRPIELFSQTTKSIEGLHDMVNTIQSRITGGAYFVHHDTICRQVSGRVPHLKQFAAQYDMIIFVGGTESSNAKVLFEQCQQSNPNSYFISEPSHISPHWLLNQPKSIGICGATSTPQWQLQLAADTINKLINNTML